MEGGGSKNFARKGRINLKRAVDVEMGGSHFITLQFNHIYSVCGKSKASFITFFFLWSFELAMEDFHPDLYSTKTVYHLHISDPLWYSTENVDCFICISLEYTENYMDKDF